MFVSTKFQWCTWAFRPEEFKRYIDIILTFNMNILI